MKYRAKSHLYRPTGGGRNLLFGLVGTARRKKRKHRRQEATLAQVIRLARIRSHARAQETLLALRQGTKAFEAHRVE